MNREQIRLSEAGRIPWKKWGPYLSERQWGTVREDYSADGDAWRFLPHDAARSKAYRWGEEGIAGISDHDQFLCVAMAFWNGRDPILKERLFGLTGPQGNHGEDVKELYYYLDSTPTHSYMKTLYKYPHAAFPYEELIERNRQRGLGVPEYELVETGVFDEDRYFDIFVEFAKSRPEDILIRVTAHNRGPDSSHLTVLPHVWFRNTWSWDPSAQKPSLRASGVDRINLHHPELGKYEICFEQPDELLFCENESNLKRLYRVENRGGYFKDGINDHITLGNARSVNPREEGTKAAAVYRRSIAAGGTATIRIRLSREILGAPFSDADSIMDLRRNEADEFYNELQTNLENSDVRNVQRQALAGMLWSKQFYYYDIPQWLKGDPGQPPPPFERARGRNHEWIHLNNADIISMPDKWEYPWYAAWDLAFHCIPLAMVDPRFAKDQLILLTREWYMHPNGQLPAYEWGFGDVNPPVHAWAAWRVYKMERRLTGRGDLDFLEQVYHKLLLNFTWWVNRKDAQGRNIFQGGFLGLDNIGVFDRSKPLPTGGHIEQADGTSWMAMYSLNMMRIALELAERNPVYQDLATKFFEHFMYIAGAITNIADEGINLWDDEDKFFYDVLHLPDGRTIPLKVRSMVGLIPFFAVETIEPDLLQKVPEFMSRMEWFLNYRPDLASLVSRWTEPGIGERRLLSLLRGHRMKRLLSRMLDENEFLSEFGVRSLSRHHRAHPYKFHMNGETFQVGYAPAESDSPLFGGNSNWRGPVWFPLNFLIIESLQKFHHYYGNDFRVEYPTGSGTYLTLENIAGELSQRLCSLFLRDSSGKRPVFGDSERFQSDPHFRNYLLFHEYFHGDSGVGLGASHQTGWTGIVAKLLQPRRADVG